MRTTKMMQQSTALLLVISRLLAVANAQDECTLCFGGATYDPSQNVSGAVPCAQLADNVSFLSQEECEDLQVLGYKSCGCSTYPDSFCPMCEGAFVNIPKPNLQIPGSNGETCEQRLFVRKSADGSCEEAQKPGFLCGCPGALEPPCNICGDDILEITEPDVALVVEGVGSSTCQEYADQAVLKELNAEQCALVQAEAAANCGCVDPRIPVSTTGEPTGPNPTSAPSANGTDAPTISEMQDDSAAACKYFKVVFLGLSLVVSVVLL